MRIDCGRCGNAFWAAYDTERAHVVCVDCNRELTEEHKARQAAVREARMGEMRRRLGVKPNNA